MKDTDFHCFHKYYIINGLFHWTQNKNTKNIFFLKIFENFVS